MGCLQQVCSPQDSRDRYESAKMYLTAGHTGNIFSAKFMPHTNNTKIISCAGDRLIKLSEVEYTSERQPFGTTRKTWYCHSDMTKRIVTEDNPNTFLSCSEDGDIRHHDLRISHPCPTSPKSCPPPLISYRPYHIELTTLTMTKANPMYLIVGGSHPHAFLHDRRMISRDLNKEWGTALVWNADSPTQVRHPRPFLCSRSDDSAFVAFRRTERIHLHDVVYISQHVNSPMQDLTNSLDHGPEIQSTCSTFTIHPLNDKTLQPQKPPPNRIPPRAQPPTESENVHRRIHPVLSMRRTRLLSKLDLVPLLPSIQVVNHLRCEKRVPPLKPHHLSPQCHLRPCVPNPSPPQSPQTH